MGGNEHLLKEMGVRVGRFPHPFLLGSPLHSGGRQDLPDPRNQVLGQLLLSSSAKPRFTEARGGETPEPKDSREVLQQEGSSQQKRDGP